MENEKQQDGIDVGSIEIIIKIGDQTYPTTVADAITKLATVVDDLGGEVTTLTAAKDEWRLALESLTPQGSEFHNDVDNCVGYVRKRLDEAHEAKKQVVKLQRELQASEQRYSELARHHNGPCGGCPAIY